MRLGLEQPSGRRLGPGKNGSFKFRGEINFNEHSNYILKFTLCLVYKNEMEKPISVSFSLFPCCVDKGSEGRIILIEGIDSREHFFFELIGDE